MKKLRWDIYREIVCGTDRVVWVDVTVRSLHWICHLIENNGTTSLKKILGRYM